MISSSIQRGHVECFFGQDGVQLIVHVYGSFQFRLADKQRDDPFAYHLQRHGRQTTLTIDLDIGHNTITQRRTPQAVTKTTNGETSCANGRSQHLVHADIHCCNRCFAFQQTTIAGKRERINQNRVRHKPWMI